MLGGFLGAGKTTTVLRVARYYQQLGKRVGLITNDQAAGLVDTALMEELNLPVREIAGGCFCCKSESLVEALGRLTEESKPEVFIAEPVGSCTDLIATVTLPLQQIYKQGYQMAPYVVLLDPYRAMQTLGVEGEPLFSPDVNYIYRKQLEEAEIIVINKVDVMNPQRLARLRAALNAEYPGVPVIELASRPGTGMEPLFDALTANASQVKRVMDVDYQRYGTGEARLGWVNLRAQLEVPKPKDGSRAKKPVAAPGIEVAPWLLTLVGQMQKALKKRKIEIAHLKVSHAEPAAALAAVQLVSTGGSPEVTSAGGAIFSKGELRINLRAEGDPDVLLAVVCEALTAHIEATPGLHIENLQTVHFRPGQPQPTHRVARV